MPLKLITFSIYLGWFVYSYIIQRITLPTVLARAYHAALSSILWILSARPPSFFFSKNILTFLNCFIIQMNYRIIFQSWSRKRISHRNSDLTSQSFKNSLTKNSPSRAYVFPAVSFPPFCPWVPELCLKKDEMVQIGGAFLLRPSWSKAALLCPCALPTHSQSLSTFPTHPVREALFWIPSTFFLFFIKGVYKR